ncbi:response regulator [Chitinophaga lutea]|uniref:Response regulator n=1 Tax=Chitinophaga lutea TaxID=2488634 RepID=A0A3N4QB19_9BACT|nr:response regulator [Chitinophaga lutea]RPE08944.1 response regulator [Chitinophaga lutea]
MTCIVINGEPAAGNVISMLIGQTDGLTLVASFDNTGEASVFMSKNTVDLVFFDIQADETKGYRFIKAIPSGTFVIFISGFSSTAISTHQPVAAIGSISVRFQKGVDMARTYSRVVKMGSANMADDYFII